MKKEVKTPINPVKPEEGKKMRRIVIETDGTSIHLVSADVAGKLELIAILQNLIVFLNQPKP